MCVELVPSVTFGLYCSGRRQPGAGVPGPARPGGGGVPPLPRPRPSRRRCVRGRGGARPGAGPGPGVRPPPRGLRGRGRAQVGRGAGGGAMRAAEPCTGSGRCCSAGTRYHGGRRGHGDPPRRRAEPGGGGGGGGSARPFPLPAGAAPASAPAGLLGPFWATVAVLGYSRGSLALKGRSAAPGLTRGSCVVPLCRAGAAGGRAARGSTGFCFCSAR